MDDLRLIAGVVAVAFWCAVWIIAPTVGGNRGQFKAPPLDGIPPKKGESSTPMGDA